MEMKTKKTKTLKIPLFIRVMKGLITSVIVQMRKSNKSWRLL